MTYYHWKHIVAESAPFLVFTAFLSAVTGFFIEANLRVFLTHPALLLLLPAFIDSCGSLADTFAARLTRGAQLGLRELAVNYRATLALAFTLFGLLALAGYGIATLLGLNPPELAQLLIVVIAPGLAVVLVSVTLALWTAQVTTRRKLDPDNFESPLLFTFSDLAGVLVFIAAARTLLG
jgi:cation transporter-like permease